MECAKTYQEIMQQKGATFSIIDQDPNMHKTNPFNPNLISVSIATSQNTQEFKAGNLPSFGLWTDFVTHIRMGGILYSNWALNHPDALNNPGKYGIPQSFVLTGELVVSFLKNQNLIYLKDQAYRWSQGHAPEINTTSMLKWYQKFYKENNPSGLVYPFN